jgi:hypothetical protein
MKAIYLGEDINPEVTPLIVCQARLYIYALRNPWKYVYVLGSKAPREVGGIAITDDVHKYSIPLDKFEGSDSIYHLIVSNTPIELRCGDKSVHLNELIEMTDQDILLYKLGAPLYGEGSWVSQGIFGCMVEMWWIDVSLPTVSILRCWNIDGTPHSLSIDGEEVATNYYKVHGVCFTESILIISNKRNFDIRYGEIEVPSAELI